MPRIGEQPDAYSRLPHRRTPCEIRERGSRARAHFASSSQRPRAAHFEPTAHTVSKQPHTKNKHRPTPAAVAESDTPRRTLRLALETLEIARGHDGFLRGEPEPALLVAAYRVGGTAPLSLVGRLLVRAQPKSQIPCHVELGQSEIHYDARFGVAERIVVLGLAVEEDSGEGVQALYAAFETPEQLLLYDALEAEPTPRTLGDWSRDGCAAPAARPVEVLLGASSLEKLAPSDDYVAAAALSVTAQIRCDEVWRLPFVARDQRNDWTLVLRLSIGA